MRSLSLFLLACLATLGAQQNGTDQPFRLASPPTGGKFVEWYGKAGRTYFVQVSDSEMHLHKWKWAPLIEIGNDENISHEVNATADMSFFRLKYTDQVPGPGETLESADFDGDGIANIDEIVPPASGPQTDPLNPDTDGDGLPDNWELAHGLDPNDSADAILLFPGSGLTQLQAFVAGVQAVSGATLANKDGDPFDDDVDAVPGENLVNWRKSGSRKYLKINVEGTPQSYVAIDMNDRGQILFMDPASHTFDNDTYHQTAVGAVWSPWKTGADRWQSIYFKPKPFKMRAWKGDATETVTTASPVANNVSQTSYGEAYGTWEQVSNFRLKAIADDGSVLGSATYNYSHVPLGNGGDPDTGNAIHILSENTFLWTGNGEGSYPDCQVLGDENILGAVTDYSDGFDKFWSGHFPAGFYNREENGVMKTYAVTEYQPRRGDGNLPSPVKVRIFDIADPTMVIHEIDGQVKRGAVGQIPFIPLPTAGGRHLLRGDSAAPASKVVSGSETTAVQLGSTFIPNDDSVRIGNPFLPETLIDRPHNPGENGWVLGGAEGLRWMQYSRTLKTAESLPLYGMDRSGIAIGAGSNAGKLWSDGQWTDLADRLPAGTALPEGASARKITPSGLIWLGAGATATPSVNCLLVAAEVRGYVTQDRTESVGAVNGSTVLEKYRALIPSSTDYTGFQTAAKSELKIAQWSEVFDTLGNGGNWEFNHEKFKNDVDAFRVRLPDIAPPDGTPEHRVKIWTVDDAGATVDPGAEADLNVFEDFHETAAFCLVADDVTDDAFAVEGKADGALGDRTYRAKPGGKLKVQWLTALGTGPKPVFDVAIPVKKTVTLQGYILKTDAGNPAVGIAAAETYFKRAREIMSSVGVKLNYTVAVVAANPAGVEFGGIVGGKFDVPFSPDNKVIQASPEVRALMDAPGFSPPADAIPVYFASSFDEANVAGITTVASVMDPAHGAYANAIFLNGDRLSESTLSHELLHVVLDATHDGNSPLWFQNHKNKVPWCLWSYKQFQPIVENGVLARRRILDSMRSRLFKSSFCK